LGLDYELVPLSAVKDEFTVLLTWVGLNPELESIFLYSHIDVVAIDNVWVLVFAKALF
jgi:hypothetical protein